MSDPVRIIIGDVRDGLRSLAERSAQCCVTSPPYWGLRDYGVDGQIGLEATPERFVETMVEVFGEVRRVLRDDGTLWLNLGDSYAGSGRGGYAGGASTLDGTTDGQDSSRLARMIQSRRRDDAMVPRSDVAVPGLKPKDLCMMPWRVALALQADGWWLRSVICWHKRSPMPESISDRPTSSWEPIFLLAKSNRYYYDAEAVKEQSTSTGGASFGKVDRIDEALEAGQGARRYERPNYREIGRNMRNVWTLSSEPYSEAHFATFPSEIPRRAIRAGTSEKGCCPACGTPWERVVDAGVNVHPGDSGRTDAHGAVQRGKREDGKAIGTIMRGRYQHRGASRTVGWEPGCACPPAEPVPCVVLDPFLGSGTTIAAARQLGRHGVGIELNPTYAYMARVRIGKAEKPHTFADHREPAEKGLFT